MYSFPFPTEQYDLILSVSTLHHGTKPQIAQLISSIHSALLPAGWVFLTVPSLQSRKWKTFTNHEEIAPGTVVPLSGPEKGLPHSFFSKSEVQELFSSFHNLQFETDSRHRWVIRASK